MTNLYTPDGSKIEVADEDVETVLAASPSLKRLADWRSGIGSMHPDCFPGGTIRFGGIVSPSPS